MINEQFVWRGDGSILPTLGYPLQINATWPAGRYGASMWSSKNLLWLYGGCYANGVESLCFSDLSTYSIDGIFSQIFIIILFIFSY